VVQENYRKFQCQNCDFSLWVVLSGREWAPEEVAELITRRFVGPLSGFRSRIGKPFSAGLRMTDDYKLEFDFGQARPGEEETAPDFSGQESVGACPKCKSRVFEHGVSYVCEKAVGPGRSCDFRSGKMILQQPVERAQMQQLLATGRTDLFTRFISKKGRPFKAYLAKTTEGRVGFEFEARKPRKLKAEEPAARAPVSAPPKQKERGAAGKPAATQRAKAVPASAKPAKTVAVKALAKAKRKAG
jgi:DNA topoisomerase-3